MHRTAEQTLHTLYTLSSSTMADDTRSKLVLMFEIFQGLGLEHMPSKGLSGIMKQGQKMQSYCTTHLLIAPEGSCQCL